MSKQNCTVKGQTFVLGFDYRAASLLVLYLFVLGIIFSRIK